MTLRAFPSWEDAAAATAVNGVVTLLPGTMYRDPKQDRDGREAWVVVLPNGHRWATTEKASGSDDLFGWEVSGEPPRITVTPSINDQWPGNPWHGHITNGEFV
ncbi:MAG: hypothetical protein WBQ18_19510 [Solirubrobacteraceae bacterium]